MKVIKTNKGESIKVDDVDYAALNMWAWRLDKDGYAIRSQRDAAGHVQIIRMHRTILGLQYRQPAKVDHRNGNKSDNRKRNLRVCDSAQNTWNVGLLPSNTSGFKNVTWVARRCKWVARVSANRKRVLIGYFDSAEEAYAAYCAQVGSAHGEFANAGEYK